MPNEFDVFLSYHAKDREAVLRIARSLRRANIRVWIDQDKLRPGLPWQAGLEKAIRASATAVVFLGPHDFGDWQRPEISALLHRMAKKAVPVIPVLLPGAPKDPDLGIFLEQNTWVDLRDGLEDEGLDRLIWGIRGRKPDETEAPLTGRVVNQHLWRRLFSARGAAIVSAALLLYWIAFPQSVARGKEFLRRMVIATGSRTELPIGEAESRRLDILINGFGETLYDSYNKMNTKGSRINGWNAAQIAVALNGLTLPNRAPISPEKVLEYFKASRSEDCHCWEDNPWGTPRRVHIGSTAWVIFAKAQLGVAAEPEELRFLLANQNPVEHGWSMFPCQEAQSGSTYATSWVILALGEQVDRGFVHESLLPEVRNAIRSGLIWLERNRINDGLWRSYPLISWSDSTSISNSGLAIHVLHRLQPSPIQRIESSYYRKWMSTLTPHPEPAYQSETFNGRLCLTENPQDEYVRYLVLPWKLVATVDAYGQGSILEREKAIAFVESVISNDNLLNETKYESWIQAELLISLRHIRSRYFAD